MGVVVVGMEDEVGVVVEVEVGVVVVGMEDEVGVVVVGMEDEVVVDVGVVVGCDCDGGGCGWWCWSILMGFAVG